MTNWVLKKEIDPIAIVALLLAGGSALYSLGQFLKGPSVSLYQPSSVVIFFDKDAVGDETLKITAPMTYLNSGATGYSSAVDIEFVDLTLGGESYTLYWEATASIEISEHQILFSDISTSVPFVIDGGSAISHQTIFSSSPRLCDGEPSCNQDSDFIYKQKFYELLSSSDRLNFRFVGRAQFGEFSVEASCSSNVSGNSFLSMAANNWAPLACITNQAS